jgi:hypothetical protein
MSASKLSGRQVMSPKISVDKSARRTKYSRQSYKPVLSSCDIAQKHARGLVANTLRSGEHRPFSNRTPCFSETIGNGVDRLTAQIHRERSAIHDWRELVDPSVRNVLEKSSSGFESNS